MKAAKGKVKPCYTQNIFKSSFSYSIPHKLFVLAFQLMTFQLMTHILGLVTQKRII